MEIEKPFKCNTCSSRFTNEDHLQIHRRRHEMSLNLTKFPSSLSGHAADPNPSFADETPTPTRFFRIGEEMGLFQDIQNVNPFDEQFSQEVQSPRTRSESSTSDHPTHEVLNTPQVIDLALAMSQSASRLEITCKEPHTNHPPKSSGVLDHVRDKLRRQSSSAAKKARLTLNLPKTPSDSGGSKSSGSSSSVSVIVRTSSSPSVITPNPKVILHKVVMPPTSNFIPIRPAPGQTTTSTHLTSLPPPPPPSKVLPSRKNNESEEAKKTEMLERNRAAAMRSRERRKVWINNLESRCSGLQAELVRVRGENKLLKEQLALHKDCDVSRKLTAEKEKNSPSSNLISVIQVSPSIPNHPRIPKPKRGRPRKHPKKVEEPSGGGVSSPNAQSKPAMIKVSAANGTRQFYILSS